ncbi:protein of unknown function [Chitinophaga jiangningensis]|uniref:DUF5123 domain-containing protein n=1 Tax=Chitinophaga jiangningensis TaxID=1419482 RepID=A0A1M6YWT5_9BACT|nr:DUF5123 domain-containing protein [Chitinophaga jiangningensis]SHL22563.1 protein of unknown function [Chitinophaga jiangningensis]
MTIRLNYNYIIVLLLAVAGLWSCKRTEDELAMPREFMPSGSIDISSEDTVAIITWKAALYTTKATYIVDLSKDTTFATYEHRFTTDTSGIRINDNFLTPRTKYFVRIRTNNADSTKNSHWLTSKSFSISGEQWLINPAATDIIDKAAVISWKPAAGFVKLELKANGQPVITVPLDAATSQAGHVQVNGLKAATTYTVEIYDAAGKSKGYISFTTKDGVPANGTVIDLSGITGRPSVLMDTISVVPSGSTIILRRAENYAFTSEVLLNKSLSIVAEISFNPAYPVITFNSPMNLTAGSTIDSVLFREVSLKGAVYTGSYVMNINKTGSIGKVNFESCNLEMFRGVIRVQTADAAGTAINTISFNNCVIDSIADYGVVNGNAQSALANIKFTNSTLYKMQKVVVGAKQAESVEFTGCTINEAPQGGGGAYLVDFNAINVTSGIKFNSCIIGHGRINAGAITVRGARAGTGTSISSSSTYTTGDYSATANAIPGVTAYSSTVAALFTDPYNGVFRIKDNGFPGRAIAGDPRWR